MKLFVKLRGSGEIRRVIEYREPVEVKVASLDESEIITLSMVDCDLCDEQGRLLVPQDEDKRIRMAISSLQGFRDGCEDVTCDVQANSDIIEQIDIVLNILMEKK